MPTFKGKDGSSKFAMNPQLANMMGGASAAPAVAGAGGPEDTAMQGMPGDGDSVEIHHGGHPDGQPPMSDAHAFHTIHHKGEDSGMGGGMDARDDSALNDSPEIHNHESYDEAEADARATMDPGDDNTDHGDTGDGADTPGDGSDEG